MTGSMRRPLAWLVCLLALPFGHAGGNGSPDIVDAEGDNQVYTPWGAWVNIAQPEIDILAVWVEADVSDVVFTFQLKDLSHRTQPDEHVDYDLTFNNAQYEFAHVHAFYAFGNWYYSFSGRTWDGNRSIHAVAGSVDLDSNTVQVSVPRALISSTLFDARASSILSVNTHTPLGHESWTNVWFRDWAPDNGPGVTIPL